VTLSIKLFFSSIAEDKIVLKATYAQKELSEQKIFVTPSFNLMGGTKNLELYLSSPISNDWFFSEFSLVNEEDGTEYDFTKEIEFYYGQGWAEGSKSGEAILSQIPEGKYHLNIYPEFSSSILANGYFDIELRRDVPISANFYYTCLLLLIYPVFYLFRKRYKESRRWQDSEYSPYDTE
jgi:hypothetical protein